LTADQIINNNIYVVNLDLENIPKLLFVDVMQSNGTFNNLHSTIKINKYTNNEYLSNAKKFGVYVPLSTSTEIRKLDGNHGNLHTYGLHKYNGNLEPFSGTRLMNKNQSVFDNFIHSTMKMTNKMFPLELSVVVQSEYSRGITKYMNYHPCHNLESTHDGDGPCSISTSINFATPQHVDIQDGSISIFGWVHLTPPQSNVYFLMSNLQIDVDGKDFTGLAVKIVDDLVITGDGRMICHGMTASNYDGSIFGMQFAANGISMVSKLNE